MADPGAQENRPRREHPRRGRWGQDPSQRGDIDWMRFNEPGHNKSPALSMTRAVVQRCQSQTHDGGCGRSAHSRMRVYVHRVIIVTVAVLVPFTPCATAPGRILRTLLRPHLGPGPDGKTPPQFSVRVDPSPSTPQERSPSPTSRFVHARGRRADPCVAPGPSRPQGASRAPGHRRPVPTPHEGRGRTGSTPATRGPTRTRTHPDDGPVVVGSRRPTRAQCTLVQAASTGGGKTRVWSACVATEWNALLRRVRGIGPG